jgi:Pentapeptide repeats (9 copies)
MKNSRTFGRSKERTMKDDIKSLIGQAVKRAHESGKLEDIERVANIYKVSAEAETQAIVVKQESMKSWAQILVPLLSVLTLGATLIGQTIQQNDAQRSREDLEWRNAVAEFKTAGNAKTMIAGLLPQVRLKPFLKSKNYGDQANQLARLILPRIGDFDGFTDLFESITWNNLDEMLTVNRTLNRVDNDYIEALEIINQREKAAPVDSKGKPNASNVPVHVSNPDNPTMKEQLEHSRTTISKELTYVCNQIGDASRLGRLKFVKANLEDVYFLNCDLSKVDLEHASFANVSFQAVNLEDARLAGGSKDDAPSLSVTEWWKAERISGAFLKDLMEKCDPGSECENNLTEKIGKPDYLKRIETLCERAKISCPAGSIKYTEKDPNAKTP